MNNLVLIPARGGSKGVPKKNIKLLGGKPLIFYSLDAARGMNSPSTICVSTDSDEIIEVVRRYGIEAPFKRPASLARDTSGSYEVIMHAVKFFEKQNHIFDIVTLLQPTSPFRTSQHIQEALSLYNSEIDMVVSVKETKTNPYFNLFEENEHGFLIQSKRRHFNRRQDCPPVYEYNGAIYIMNVQSLIKKPLSQFERIIKYVMSEEDSLDIDSPLDFLFAQTLIDNNFLS